MGNTIKFWSRVDRNSKSPCWIWTGATDKSGYGYVMWDGKVVRTHRLAYQLHHEVELPRQAPTKTTRTLVLHTCDNPPCCNPAHLWLGSNKENRDDCISKGRNNTPRGDMHNYRRMPECMARGSRHPRTKLTESDVLNIRTRIATGEMLTAIGDAFGVTKHVVWSIKERITWKHI